MLLGQLSLWFQNFFPFQTCPRIACEFPGFTSYHPSIFAKTKFKNHGGLLVVVQKKEKIPRLFLIYYPMSYSLFLKSIGKELKEKRGLSDHGYT